MPARTNQLAIMLSRRCDMSCGHCSVASNPNVKDATDDDRLRRWVDGAIESGVSSIQFTGGEPMLRRELLLELLQACRHASVNTSVTSNGTWAVSQAEASRWLRRLRAAGMGRLTISYDRYHAEFQGPEPVLRIARACKEQGFTMGISVTRVRADEDLGGLIEPFANLEGVHCRFYDVQWIGAARRMDRSSLRGEVEGFCNAATAAALTDDGRLTACNGPSYFASEDSPLILGEVEQQPTADLLAKHANDPILSHIRAEGPAGLKQLLEGTRIGHEFPFRDSYSGMCELCLHLTDVPEVVAELRKQLDVREATRAQDIAKLKVVRSMHSGGELTRNEINGRAVGRLIVKRTHDGRWDPSSDRVLGRHDLDWLNLTNSVISNGLAPALAAATEDPEFSRWSPSFVLGRIHNAAQQSAVRSSVQRQIIEQLDATLGDVGSDGVLLKGAAWLVTDARYPRPVRSGGDVDLWVNPEVAHEVWGRLTDAGFKSTGQAQRSAEHHLTMLSHLGVGVEVHTSIMPSRWGLPEQSLLAASVPAGKDLSNLRLLNVEGRILHAVVHCTQHLYSHGLKLGWELVAHERHEPAIDWSLLKTYVEALRMPRAFWTPLGILAEDLELAVPESFLESVPADERQRRIDLIARKRIWTAAEHSHEPNVFMRQGVHAMLEESLAGQVRSVTQVLLGSMAGWRRQAQKQTRRQKGQGLIRQARVAVSDWRRYRSALQRKRAVEHHRPS